MEVSQPVGSYHLASAISQLVAVWDHEHLDRRVLPRSWPSSAEDCTLGQADFARMRSDPWIIDLKQAQVYLPGKKEDRVLDIQCLGERSKLVGEHTEGQGQGQKQ
jgi:hypothetical protein